ncbi:MAG: sugar ABC transporter permease, partial [Spirochaetaceae bacterium]
PYVLGESRPRMISLYLYRLYFSRPIGERPIAAAMLVLILLCGAALVLMYAMAVRGVEERERRL